ncbi:Com family DNA-binding transcriptional regulator [Protofrankia symbiont of Coriaria ruscifolia]|uniref:Com family DNA-binding transcriptional regulator n=1 Tax=Protofrankia symbiont of Coriaria ruscifolia TaxID=1306542 RepID=UPI0010415E55
MLIKIPGDSVTCEWDGCAEEATHAVEIVFPGEAPESWWVCRPHDRALKCEAVARRPPASPQQAAGRQVVRCGQCDRILDGMSALDPIAPACPACESTARHIRVELRDNVGLYDERRVKTTRRGTRRPLMEVRDGADYTGDLQGWGERTLVCDREHDRYRELIVLYDGTRIESTAKLSDHH